jgi:alkylation response protein AidB-like acyl-CoA dehydrogenase
MDFSYTVEQDDLRALVRDFLSKQTVRSREPGSYDTALWRRLGAELGLTDPSLRGVELAIVLEETGRALLALPYLSTMVAAQVLPASLLSQSTVGAVYCGPDLSYSDGVVEGTADGVMDADVATVAVVAAGDGLYAVPLDGVDRTPVSTLDHSRPAATLTFRGAPATRLPASPDAALDAVHLALAVEALGVASASLDMTVAHLTTRHQFGQALANFQALRHRVADLAVVLEAATSTTWYAVRAGDDERPVVAPMAKLVAADAAYAVTAESIQLHGGIGFTWEHDAHRYLKRATVTRLTQADPVTLRRIIAERAGILDPPIVESPTRS